MYETIEDGWFVVALSCVPIWILNHVNVIVNKLYKKI